MPRRGGGDAREDGWSSRTGVSRGSGLSGASYSASCRKSKKYIDGSKITPLSHPPPKETMLGNLQHEHARSNSIPMESAGVRHELISLFTYLRQVFLEFGRYMAREINVLVRKCKVRMISPALNYTRSKHALRRVRS